MQKRRQLLRALLALGWGAADGAAASRAPRIDRPGLQLYTVRTELARDFGATLARIAVMGYREVELAGNFGQSTAAIRSRLADLGLTAPSAHVGDALLGPEAPRVIDEALACGHRYLVQPWVDPAHWRDLDGWRRRADAFNRAGEACRRAGLQFCYHHHHFEFATLQGERPFDLLLSRCDAALVRFELDLFWTAVARQDPLALLRAHPQRFPLVHLKQLRALPRLAGNDVLSLDMAEAGALMTEVGPGVIDFAALLADPASRDIRHFFVEHDRPARPLASTEASLRQVLAL
jgi:sugar phosphate isomerase/epimerase